MNILEVGLSFVEGLALIASPCILPVLPLVLSASVEGGRKRPFGIITGFVLAFTVFALLSRKLVSALGIDSQLITYGSLVLLALFGVVLISEHLSAKFSTLTQRFASVGSGFSVNTKDGYFSGVVIGMLIGLVWTPCAGPILAAVLVQVIREQSDLNAFFMIAAFATGAGVPMLIIALTGRSIMTKLGFFTKHGEAVRKSFGVIILIAVAFIASGGSAKLLSASEDAMAVVADANGLQAALPAPYPAPEFAGLEGWLNSESLTMQSLKGKVVLIDFWTYSCINCVRTLPYLTRWDAEYRDKGLVIIGVHAPEFEFEKSRANVEAALAKYGIKYPVAQDNRLDTWTAFQNRYWPAHYLINQEGQVVYIHFGEGKYAQTENNIRVLLGLDKVSSVAPEISPSSNEQTHETYLGHGRAANFASPEGIVKDKAQAYSMPQSLLANQWALSGAWRVDAQYITAQEKGAALQLNFTAGKVFLVLGTEDGKLIDATVRLNGKALGDAAGKDASGGTLTVSGHALYELVNQGQVKNGLLEITSARPGLTAYAFTFGN